LLYALERRKLLRADWVEPTDGGRRRKYYGLTKIGTAASADRVAEWAVFVRGMSRVLGGAHA
jgi:DNA-binding PadR family transcriptional regulator